MPKLMPKDWTEVAAPVVSETSAAKADAIKAAIKALVTVPTEYDEIVAHIERTLGLGGVVDIVALIDAVRDEWHPPKVVEGDEEIAVVG